MLRAKTFWQISHGLIALWLLLAAAAGSARADFQGATHMVPFDEDIIAYARTAATNPVSRLQERLDKNEAKLVYDERFGYLPSLLDALKVPRSSGTRKFFAVSSFRS